MARLRVQVLAAFGVMLCWLVLVANARSPNENLARGVQALEAHDFAAAQQVFSLLVKQHPSAANYGYLAMAEVGEGNLKQAVADFKKSIQLGGSSASIHYNLGLAYLEDHQPQAAIQEFQQAISLDSNYIPARYALGVTFLNFGQARKAVACFAEARKVAPYDPRIWANLVKAQFEAGESKEAIDTAEDALPPSASIISKFRRPAICLKTPTS